MISPTEIADSSAGLAAGPLGDLSAETNLALDTDEALVERLTAGNRRAFDELVQRYKSLIYYLARWQCGPAQAEDLTQEVFLELFRSVRSFAGRSSFRTWLIGLTRNVCRSQGRKTRRSHQVFGVEREEMAEIPDQRLDALERLQNHELKERVQTAVAGLPEHHRVVLLLREWQGMSYQELAQTLEVPVGTIRSRLHNARAILAQRLGDSEQEAPDAL